MLAASWLGVPVLIHEQNVVPGAVNRMLSGRAAIVAISWEESRKYLKRPDSAVLTGNPVRPEVIAATREDGLTSFGLDGSRPTVLAFGGSQGSASINRALIGALPTLAARVSAQFVLATGNDKFSESIALARDVGVPVAVSSNGIARSERGDIIIMPYIYNMPHALACADLALTRSGAITLAELAVRGVPAVLVPHPNVPDNVQEKNARAVERRGAARVMLDRELEPAALASVVADLLADPGALRAMADASRANGIPDAGGRAADCVERIMRARGRRRRTRSHMGLLA
jgi:UDP-N-acetylglucosamine--N-acetylmuramyl-(pentapeptide) pyrophosphoryl-undecaprenol N-acetylglucosamine transferase